MNRQILGRAVRRAVELSERVGDRLREFVSTEELPYSYGLGGEGERKPNYPSLYLSRSTDPGLMKLPGEGTATVKYRVKRREIDESREDGQPLYGASIEIQSLDPVAEETGLESTVFLKEFAHPIGKRVPFLIEGGLGAFGQSKASSTLQAVSGRALRKAGFPKDAMKRAVQMRKVFAKRGQSTRGVASAHDWAGADAVIDGKTISRRNGVDIMYDRADALKEFAANGLGALLKQSDRSRKGVGKLLDAAQKGNRGATMAFRKTKRKAIPMKEAKADGDFFTSMNKERAAAKLRSPFSPADELRMKRHYVKKAVRSNMQLFENSSPASRYFAEARDRDGEGRFAAGNIPGADDFAIAQAAARKKKAVSVMPGGAALTRGK